MNAPEASDHANSMTAPEVLLAVLGEYVANEGGGAWQETLVSAVEMFGHTSAAARQAIARAIRDGALVARRHGKRSWLQLSDSAAGMLRSGNAKSAAAPTATTEQWDVILVRPTGRPPGPDAAGHDKRTRAILSRFGKLGNGARIAPHRGDGASLQRALAEDPAISVVVLRAEIAFPDARELVESAWDIGEIGDRYSALVADYESRTPRTDAECFVAWTELHRRWREGIRRDPGLPPVVLPDPWPREAAERVVARARRAWRPRAVAAFAQLAERLPPAPRESD